MKTDWILNRIIKNANYKSTKNEDSDLFLAAKLTEFERSRRQTRNYQKLSKCDLPSIHFIWCSKFAEAEHYSQKLLSIVLNYQFQMLSKCHQKGKEIALYGKPMKSHITRPHYLQICIVEH